VLRDNHDSNEYFEQWQTFLAYDVIYTVYLSSLLYLLSRTTTACTGFCKDL